jgi:cell division protein FtsI (penicillin-binding protein 3)
MNVIANGGLWVRPHVVRGMRNESSFIPATGQPEPRRVIRANTAATLRSMLEGVVLEGTGTKARLDGYTAAGKTGTAQKFDPATGHYSASQTIASFVGFAPINTPAVTILITLDSPVGLVEGGDTAAPVFKRVAEQVLSYMGVPQDAPLSPRFQRASLQAGAPNSEADVSDFDPTQMESATAPADVVAPPPQRTPLNAPAPTLALVEGEAVTVPQLSGKTVREVSVDCARLGISPVLVGTGVALEQDPVGGTTVRRGSRVTVRFGRPPHDTSSPPAHPSGGQQLDRRQ